MADIVSAVAVELGTSSIVAVEEADDLIDGLITITIAEEAGISDIQERLGILNERILRWDSNQPTSRAFTEEQSVLVDNVTEVRQLEEILLTFHFTNEEDVQNGLLKDAQSILHEGMTRLVEEFNSLLRHYNYEFSQLLNQHGQNLESDHMIFQAPNEENMDDFSFNSFGEEPADSGSHSLTSSGQYDNLFDLIPPAVISNLKSIANVLFQCNYEKECFQTYICARKVALDDFLSSLGMGSFSIEEVLKMEWSNLNREINKWKRTMKAFISLYLASDKRLCELVFRDLPKSARNSCFVDASKSSVFQLLTFGHAVAISQPEPEKLFQILDIYEVLGGLLTDIENFFPEDDDGLSIQNEYHHLLLKLSDSIKATMDKFRQQIQTSISTTAFARAGVHHLTRYVMNYVTALAAYAETLNCILTKKPDEDQSSALENSEESISDMLGCPFAQYSKSVTLVLESNLVGKSSLYNDDAMSNIFMMNNIYYMVKKVKNSDLRHFVADEWIREHNAKFQKHARDYQRASWNSVINLLSDDDIRSNGAPSRRILRQKFESFTIAFEEVYRTQTGWVVPDALLRDDLRIAISNVLQKYRGFCGRYSQHLEGERHLERCIKYSADDLENLLLHFFEGCDRSLPHLRRR